MGDRRGHIKAGVYSFIQASRFAVSIQCVQRRGSGSADCVVRFKLISDHASLITLLTKKALSLRLLKFCEFLADSKFEEVNYVCGADNVVPDFFNRPWGHCRTASVVFFAAHVFTSSDEQIRFNKFHG